MDNKITIGSHVIYHGDYFEVLQDFKDDSVDHVITDPPYSSNTHKNAKTNKSDKPSDDKLVTFDSIDDKQFKQICGLSVVLAKRWIIMTCDYKHACLTYDWLEFIRQGVWVKNNPMPQITGDRPGQGHETVLILHSEGKKRWNNGGHAAIWKHNVVNKSIVPTQKPQGLINDFILQFTDKDETILDMFMGSGTVGKGCIRNGRKFIGIEKDEGRFDIARIELEREYEKEMSRGNFDQF